MAEKPYSPACERNKEPIWLHLKKYLKPRDSVLEIGSGTGQHAVFFKNLQPDLEWQCSDLAENLSGISMWLKESEHSFDAPIELSMACLDQGPQKKFNCVYTANTFHIADLETVLTFCKQIRQRLLEEGCLIIYGPFLYENKETAASNLEFDLWLKSRDVHSGLRDFETIANTLTNHGLSLENDIDMPANNQLLIFKKREVLVDSKK